MEFREDDTFTMQVDGDSVEKSMEHLMDRVTDGMSRYMEDLMYEQTGVEMTVEEILASTDMTMEDLVAMMFPEASAAELKEQIAAEFSKEGRFKAEDGKLFTSAGIDLDVDTEVYVTYSLDSGKLTLLEYAGSDGSDELLYPMEFTKIS